MVCCTGNTQPYQAQQRLRDAVGTTGFKGGRIGVLTPDAVKLCQDAMAEDIEETL